MSAPHISDRIDIVVEKDATRILVDGQDITGWLAWDTTINVQHDGPNTLPTLTVKLTANQIRTRYEIAT